MSENGQNSCLPEKKDQDTVKYGLEALLFVASDPLSLEQLADIFGVKKKEIQTACEELIQDYQGRGIRPRFVAGGVQMVTDPAYAPFIEKLYRPKFQQLSAAAMETLAIVAYKQPITRAEISEIRGVDCDGVMSTLLDKHLVCEVGRVEGAGRAILYGTSKQFLEFFGLNSISELPQLEEDKPGPELTL